MSPDASTNTTLAWPSDSVSRRDLGRDETGPADRGERGRSQVGLDRDGISAATDLVADDGARSGDRIDRARTAERTHEDLAQDLRLALTAHRRQHMRNPAVPQRHCRHQRVCRSLAWCDHVGRRRIQRESTPAVVEEDTGRRVDEPGAEGVVHALDQRYRVSLAVGDRNAHRVTARRSLRRGARFDRPAACHRREVDDGGPRIGEASVANLVAALEDSEQLSEPLAERVVDGALAQHAKCVRQQEPLAVGRTGQQREVAELRA